MTNNTYFASDLADSNFVACGTGCRKIVVTSVSLPAARTLRAALAWQSCMTSEGSVPSLNNDLDLALVCSGTTCSSSTISNTVTSELEMLELGFCAGAPKGAIRTCSLEIRIKNGATLQPCGSTTTERVGVAWRVE